MHNVKNNASSTITAGISSADLSMGVNADNFPATPFYLTFADGTNEIVEVTAKTGTTFTIGRGKDGTTAQAHSSGAGVELRLVAAHITELQQSSVSAGQLMVTISPSGDTTGNTDTDNINNALASKAKIQLDGGNFYITNKGLAQCLLWDHKNIHLVGCGMTNTKLIVKSTVPSNVDVLKVIPSNNGNLISDFGIERESGANCARHLVVISLTDQADQGANHLARSYIQRLSLDASTYGNAIYLDHPAPRMNGMFCAGIRDNVVWNGGMKFNRIGDSVDVTGNTFTGRGRALDWTGVGVSGNVANSCNILNNNCTANGGFLIVRLGTRMIVQGNNLEHYDNSEGCTSVIEFVGQSDIICENIDILGNTITAYSASVADAIVLGYTNNVSIRSGLIREQTNAIWPKSTSTNTFIYPEVEIAYGAVKKDSASVYKFTTAAY